MDGLVFHEAEHRYTLDGQPVPGVTRALKLISEYRDIDPAVLEASAARGRMVHRVIELDCLGDLDVPSLDDMLVPYYQAWREFLALSGFRVALSESKLACRRYRFAGQPDLFGHLNGIPAVIDAKNVVAVQPSTGPQTAAYEHLVRQCHPTLLPAAAPCRRYALQLHPRPKPGQSARWSLVPFTDPADLRLFLACLTVTHHLEKRNLIR